MNWNEMSSLRRRVDRYYANQLLVHELLYAETGKFTSVTGVLDPSERQFRRGPGRVVDEDHSSVKPAGHAFTSLYVSGEYGASKTIL